MRIITCSASSIRGINNFGDELLTEMYHSWIREAVPGVEVVHLSIPQIGRLSQSQVASLRSAGSLIFTGGGYFADGDVGSRHVLRKHLRALRNRQVYWPVFQAAQRGAVSVAVFGLEVGPLANPFYRRSVRRILTGARTVVVRNKQSEVAVKQLCGRAKSVSVHMDAALAVATTQIATKVPDRRYSSDGTTRVGLHIHSLRDEREITAYREIVDLIRQHVSPAETRFYYIHDQRKRDRHPGRSIRTERVVKAEYPDVVSISYDSARETVQRVAELDFLVTTKLHMGIVARSLGVPVLATGRHPKIGRFFESIGESDLWRSVEAVSTAGLPERLSHSLVRKDQSRMPVAAEHIASALENQQRLVEFLEEH